MTSRVLLSVLAALVPTAAALPAPFMITIVVLLVTGIPATEAIPIILAAMAAHALTFGLGLLPRSPSAPPAAKQQEAGIANAAVETGSESQPLNEGKVP